jgi:hypothetical protein
MSTSGFPAQHALDEIGEWRDRTEIGPSTAAA